MPLSTDPASEPHVCADSASDEASKRPHGYTLADEEMDRLTAKRDAGNVLDPIALNDPVGQSVEKVILRVGIAVVAALVAGILLAQLACKNIQTWGIPDFSLGVSTSSLESALEHGISWGGDVVHFPAADGSSFDADNGAVRVVVSNDAARTFDQLVATSQSQATALAMNLFRDPDVDTVTYVVRAPVSEETGTFSTAFGSEVGDVLTIIWQRDPSNPAVFSSTIEGYDPQSNLAKAELASKTDKA